MDPVVSSHVLPVLPVLPKSVNLRLLFSLLSLSSIFLLAFSFELLLALLRPRLQYPYLILYP